MAWLDVFDADAVALGPRQQCSADVFGPVLHEGIYILDGLLANTSDIQPEIVHGDTQAQLGASSSRSRLFGDNIDWQLIATHLHDMLRVVISIRLGKITASFLRRLGTYSRKNKLYFAFRELGKAVRTLFLLRYIDDNKIRKTIHAATNKSYC
ncbi:hypothetical protein AEA00_10000 [Xanthomonas campestris pv. campestris]|nr:hypothetical protein AEA00_10000 [Xanthomonas campestris pv. campestris]